ncbi:MAG: Glycosyl transferase, group 1 [Candidatus Levybacteria bacterium GW2011_GWA2_40_8]|nr:MAG: Glycosyl transferase, group 1 [Candidatus Levybacteria bacterium GW2011_GWA2_40_8]
MRIAVNGYEAAVSRFGYDKKTGLPLRVGSAEFAFRLIWEFARDKENSYITYLPTKPSSDMPKESENFKYSVFKTKKLWTMIGLSKKLLKDKELMDVFFSPTHYLPLFLPAPSAVSILDVSYLMYPELFKKMDLYQLKLWGGYSIRKARKIITISKSSKNDIIRAYGISPDKIFVAYPGLEDMKNVKDIGLENKYKIKGGYILFVGTVQPRKNVEKLIEAFSKLPDRSLTLIIIGKLGWMYDQILEAPGRYGISKRVKFLDSVSDDELPSFYKNAQFFILPSLYEGFGLPILEAMQYGCPVITSNVSSLPEAGGDAVLYVDPENVSDITSKMQKLLTDKNLRDDLVKRGFRQVKKFSWEKTARDTISALKSIA